MSTQTDTQTTRSAPPPPPPPDFQQAVDEEVRHLAIALQTAGLTPDNPVPCPPDDPGSDTEAGTGDEDQQQPDLNAFAPIRELSMSCGYVLRETPIYCRNKVVVAADHDDALEPMDADWFCTWAEQHIRFVGFSGKKGKPPNPTSLKRETAAKILRSSEFRSNLRQISYTRPVRMPVIRDNGDLELLPPGYDEATQTWTENEIDFDHDLSLAEAMSRIDRWFSEWPWEDGSPSVLNSANCAAIVGCMIAQFCDSLMRKGDKRPMLAVTANQPGTGKSTLVRMVYAPVHGLVGEGDLPEDKQELIKLLQTAAINRRPYLILDDIGHYLSNTHLNRFITSASHQGRIMGGQRFFDESNMTQVAVTGNAMGISGDLARRTCVSSLFVPGEIQGRTFRFPITDAWLALPETRSEMLAACWAITKAGYALTGFRSCPQGKSFLQGFERWSTIAQSCLTASRFRGDPLAAGRTSSMACAEDTEIRTLLARLGDEIVGPGRKSREIDYDDIVRIAREESVLEWLVGYPEDPLLDRRDRTRLGMRLSKWRGRVVARKSDGKQVRFGDRRSGGIRRVTITLLDD